MSRFLVLGATGRIGHPVAVELLRRGHDVRGACRDLVGPTATDLGRRGAEVVPVDLDDAASIASACNGTDGVFFAGTAQRCGPRRDVRHGEHVIEACQSAGVPLVYCSAAGARADSPVPMFKAKARVEQCIATSGVAATVLAPVYLMENLFHPWHLQALQEGRFPCPVRPEGRLQQVALRDVAAFAARVLQAERHEGARIELAGEEDTGAGFHAALERAWDRPLEFMHVAGGGLDAWMPGLARLTAWLEQEGHHVDLPALHARHPLEWTTFEAWAREQPPARMRHVGPQVQQAAGAAGPPA